MSVCMSLLGGVLLLNAAGVDAQLSGGSSAGGSGAMGQGGPDIRKPGQGTDNPSGSQNQNREHGRTPSGPMDQGRPESIRPGQGGDTLPGRIPDSTGGSNSRPGSGTGSGSMGTPGGSGGGMGGSGGAGGGGK